MKLERSLKSRRALAAATKVPAIITSIRVEGVENLFLSTLPNLRKPMVRDARAASSITTDTGRNREKLRNKGPRAAMAWPAVWFADGPIVELGNVPNVEFVSGPGDGTTLDRVAKSVPRTYRAKAQPTAIPTR